MHRAPVSNSPKAASPFAAALTLLLLLVLQLIPAVLRAEPPKDAIMLELDSIPIEKADGTTETLAKYRGKAILIVNTASECGFTPQYADLEKLHQLYRDRGLVVLAFPCNSFGSQEPGTNAEIQEFCSSRYKVTFPVMAKVEVLRPGWSPLFRTLCDGDGLLNGNIQWNFEKFLIDAQGRYTHRFGSRVGPMSPEVVAAVEEALPPQGAK